jgi:hypothetical protein
LYLAPLGHTIRVSMAQSFLDSLVVIVSPRFPKPDFASLDDMSNYAVAVSPPSAAAYVSEPVE